MYESRNQREFARKLRKDMTEPERKLWWRLRKRQLMNCRFRRQYAVGPYVVDFECFAAKLVVELDGGQHNTVDNREYDAQRTNFLNAKGYKVLRYWNNEVEDDIDSVLEAIAINLTNRLATNPHPGPPPRGEGE